MHTIFRFLTAKRIELSGNEFDCMKYNLGFMDKKSLREIQKGFPQAF